MADLGAFVIRQEKRKIADLIDKKNTTTGLPRPYLGMSGLGSSCTKALWYSFRWVKEGTIDGRVNRIFNTGHRAEEFMVKDLECIGVKTKNTLEDQIEFSCVGGHCKGHPDGQAINIPGAEKTEHLLELKTSNDKYYQSMIKNGVKKEKPTHYSQMIIYMHFSKLTRALYMVYNKNDSNYYTERIHANNAAALELIKKAENIIMSNDSNEFLRIGSGKKDWWECSFCDYKEICFQEEEALTNCRTCNNADIWSKGEWKCSAKDNLLLSNEDQAKNDCSMHDLLDCLRTK